MSYKFEIVAQNFTCPDFHTCTLMDTLAVCEEKVKAGMQAVCQAVSTNLTEFLGKSCGKYRHGMCYEPTGITLPGREMAMAIVHNETQEKVYNFVTGNLTLLAFGLGTVALGFIGLNGYMLIKTMSTPPEGMWKLDENRLSHLGTLLDHADVSVGHLNGSHINFAKFTNIHGDFTFRDVSNRIEELYSQDIKVMREKQERMLIDAARPSLTVDETKQVREAIQWRKSSYLLLDKLYAKSQTKLDANTLARVWDKALNKVSTWRKTPILRDIELLEQMGTNPPAPKTEILTGLQLANKESSRLLFGKEAILNIARIVRDFALTVFYTCWIFSGNWKDNIISSFQDVKDDFQDLGTATVGIFSPAFASKKT